MKARKVGRILIILISLFMIFFPSIQVYKAWQTGLILISLPLFLMFIAGLLGLRLASHKQTWVTQ